MKKFLILIVSLIGLFTYSQNLDQSKRNKLQAQIKAYVQENTPGLAVGIVKDGAIIFEDYSGLSNLENNTPVTKDTRFNIASNAKQFTALCILKLKADGKIDLNDDIRKYLPEHFPDVKDPISVSNLLTHSSGIRDVYDLWALKGQTWWKLFIGNSDAMDLLRGQRELNFKPGSKYMYSNSNYILLTEIVKVISGKSFDTYTLDLFRELDMEQTSFLTNYMSVIPNKARPYGNWNGWKEYPFITEIHGDGALFTSLKDQMRWEVILQKTENNTLTADLLKRSQLPVADSNISEYGYGLMFDEYKGMSYSYHDGNTGAYNATFIRFPEKNTAIIVMSNNGNVPTNYLAKLLADICFDLDSAEIMEYPSGPEYIEELNDITNVLGSYETDGGTLIKIVEKNGELYREIYQRDPVRLIREEGNLFYYETLKDLKIAFTRDESNEWMFTIYLSSQKPNIGKRLPSFNGDQNYLESLNGKYYNAETETTIEIAHLEGDKYSITKNGRSRDGVLLLEDLLRMNSYDIRISRDSQDKINGLLVKNGRIDNVRFSKK